MKNLVAFVLCSTLTMSVYGADMVLPIHGVTDGDTIKSRLNIPCPLCNVSVRIRGIDTPETASLAKCEKERVLGIKAKNFLIDFTQNKTSMLVKEPKWDKYGGRINGIVKIDGINVADLMISKGLARPYTGRGKKSDWCI